MFHLKRAAASELDFGGQYAITLEFMDEQGVKMRHLVRFDVGASFDDVMTKLEDFVKNFREWEEKRKNVLLGD